jgi:uncharacterized protein (UPF0332 family)
MSDSPNAPFNWNEYLTLAQELSQRSDESARRSAVSRAYYAAFNRARLHLTEAQGQGSLTEVPAPGARPEGQHEICWKRFCESGNDACIDIGELGKRLKGSRVEADYDANAQVARTTQGTDMVIQTAKRFIKKLDDLDPAYPPRKLPTTPLAAALPLLRPPQK